MENPKVDPITLVSTAVPRIRLYDRQGDEIAPGTSATGFFYGWGQRTFLISNWHVFSGKNAETGEYLAGTEGREPWTAKLDARYIPSSGLTTPLSVTVRLRAPEDGDRLWSEHPISGRAIDVAAIEITGLPNIDFNCANDDICGKPFIWGAGDQMFILGYPKGISGGRSLPIWKSATVASEPNERLDGQPKFLVDAASTPGMSGSPVIFRSSAYSVPHPDPNEKEYMYSIGSTIQQLIGIYSGRVAELDEELKNDPLAAQLGYVWRRETILETVAHAAKRSYEFPTSSSTLLSVDKNTPEGETKLDIVLDDGPVSKATGDGTQ